MFVQDSSFIARFWPKVEKTDGCWEWRAAKNSKGYGCIGHRGKLLGAHRVAWILTNGAIPNGLHVLHECDNPGCVNPNHLFLGTHQDNMRDRDSKGRCRARGLPGDNSARRKLTSSQVREIRERVARGAEQQSVAAEYGVHKATVNDLVLRKTWMSVA